MIKRVWLRPNDLGYVFIKQTRFGFGREKNVAGSIGKTFLLDRSANESPAPFLVGAIRGEELGRQLDWSAKLDLRARRIAWRSSIGHSVWVINPHQVDFNFIQQATRYVVGDC